MYFLFEKVSYLKYFTVMTKSLYRHSILRQPEFLILGFDFLGKPILVLQSLQPHRQVYTFQQATCVADFLNHPHNL